MANAVDKPFEKGGRPYAVIGDKIKEALKVRGMTQTELAEATKIPKATLNFYVNGRTGPKQDALYLIAQALRVRPDWLMGYDVPMTHAPAIETVPIHDTFRIPLLGRVAAGEPIYTEGNIEGELYVDPDLAKHGTLFALRVKGDSMSPQILDQDIIICREQAEADNGELVVATVGGGEGCVKRLKKYAHAISLVSVNPAYEPMYFGEEDVASLPVRIMGKVVEIRRAVV